MAELTTDAQALSEAATSFDRISSDLKSEIGQVDSTAGDLAGALSGPAGDGSSDDGKVDSFVGTGDAGVDTRAGDAGTGMQSTEGGVTGMFCSAGDAGADSTATLGQLTQLCGGMGGLQQVGQMVSQGAQSIQQLEQGVIGGGNVEFEWKVEEGESRGFQQGMEARSTNGCTGDACNGDAAGILFGDGGDGAQGGISTAQLTISGTISDPSAVDGRYSFVFDGNADTSGGHTYFDGKFLTAHDLMREQVYLSDTGFDLV